MLYGGITLPNRPDLNNIRRLDIMQIPMLRSMSKNGFLIDIEHFRDLEFRLTQRMGELKRLITDQIPPEALDRFLELSGDPEDDDEEGVVDEDSMFNVDSGQDVAELLYSVLKLDQGHVEVKKTKGGAKTTGKKTLEQLKREHPVVPLVLEYRENAKLRGTYAIGLPRQARYHPAGPNCHLCGRRHYTVEPRLHSDLVTTRAVTGRICSRRPNLANVPQRTDLGRAIRAGFIAPPGHVLVQRDFAQIELRLMADRANDPKMNAIFAANGDIHTITAMAVFGIDDPKLVNKNTQRAPAKNVAFGVMYGITGSGLLDLMASTFATANLPLPDYMTEAWCEDFMEKWFALYPSIRAYLRQEEAKARRYGIVWTMAGRVRRIPEVSSCHAWIQEAGVRQGCNHGIQGYSADIMKLAMAEIYDRLVRLAQLGYPSWPLMTIYDELLIETEEDNGELIEDVLGDVMDNVLVDKSSGLSLCRVPILSDGHIIKRWVK